VDESPLVSIVVNNYNYARFLRDAVMSALAQTYPRVEVIVVDDGSTDESREVIASFGDSVVPVLKENGGQGSALNAGFGASRGEIVLFLDADDFLFPQTVERVVTCFAPGVAKVHYRLVDGEGNDLGLHPVSSEPLGSGDLVPLLLDTGTYVTPAMSGNAFAREALQHALPMPADEWRICADAYLFHTAPFYGQVRALEETLGVYRLHGGNLWSWVAGSERDPSRERLDAETFHTGVRDDLRKEELVRRTARQLGHRVPEDLGMRDWERLRIRISSLRLGPRTHPVASDRRLGLTLRGVRAAWRAPIATRRKLFRTAWFVAAGLMPTPVAKTAISWVFATHLLPQPLAEGLETARRHLLRCRPSPNGG